MGQGRDPEGLQEGLREGWGTRPRGVQGPVAPGRLAGERPAQVPRLRLARPHRARAHEPPHSQVYETPFYVAVDHDKKKVVISIRGTLSPKVCCPSLPAHRWGPPQSPCGVPLASSRPPLPHPDQFSLPARMP